MVISPNFSFKLSVQRVKLPFMVDKRLTEAITSLILRLFRLKVVGNETSKLVASE